MLTPQMKDRRPKRRQRSSLGWMSTNPCTEVSSSVRNRKIMMGDSFLVTLNGHFKSRGLDVYVGAVECNFGVAAGV